jgi:hypothetical protein
MATKFQVPQFVEVEDKIFWHLTLKQFIYVAGGCGLSIVFYLYLPLWLAFFFIAPILGFALALAFYRYNNRPFIATVESAAKYLWNTKLYIWRKEDHPATPAPEKGGDEASASSLGFLPKLSNSKLKELTWTLDTKEGVNPGTRETGQK